MSLCPKCRIGEISVHLDDDDGTTYDWCGPCAARKLRICTPKTLRSVHIWAIHAVGETCNTQPVLGRIQMREAVLTVKVRVQFDPAIHLAQVVRSIAATITENPMVPDTEHVTVERTERTTDSFWREKEA